MAQNKSKKYMRRYVDDLFEQPLFLARMAAMADDDVSNTSKVAVLIVAFKIPMQAADFIWHFMETGNKDYNLLTSRITVYGDVDRKLEPEYEDGEVELRMQEALRGEVPYVYLVLPKNVTKTEIKEFVSERWDDLIEPKLVLAGRDKKVKKTRRSATRQNLIDRLLLEGYKSSKLVDEYNKRSTDPADVIGLEDLQTHLHRKKKS
jgi:hypothetical protein